MAPLRILELRTVRGTGGGPEKTILLGTAQTDASRYQVTVCYIRDERDPEFHIDQKAAQLPVEYVEVRERHSFDIGAWRQVRQIAVDRHIDIVHAHDYKANLLAWLLARREGMIPMSTAHGYTGHTWRERRVYYPGDRRLLSRFPRVVAVSSELRSTLIRAGARPEQVTVILNGIDPDAFKRSPEQRDPARTKLGIHADDIAIGAVGRLEPQKRFDQLIRAFAAIRAQFPRTRLLIAGEGSSRPTLERLAIEQGLSSVCRLLGHVNDVSQLHQALDMFVQSSAYEGTPNAVLEAMALETPVIATEAGGTGELARNGIDALIVPCQDEAALVAAMRSALDDPIATRQRAETARRRIETDLSFTTRMRRVEAVYDELATRFHRRDAGRRVDLPETCATR